MEPTDMQDWLTDMANKVTSIVSAQLVPTVQGPAKRTDPYLLWAQKNGEAYLIHRDGKVRVALRTNDSMNFQKLSPSLPNVELVPLSNGMGSSTLSALVRLDDDATLSALEQRGNLVMAEAGMWPIGCPAVERPERDTKALGKNGVDARVNKRVVVGVIDGRLGFANQGFCTENGNSIIDYFWDQSATPTRGSPWKSPAGFDYGCELNQAALKQLHRELHTQCAERTPEMRDARQQAERATYRHLSYELPQDADWSHGTHVLDTILSAIEGESSQLGVIYVQLPDTSLRDTSGHWTTTQVLDGVHYILARAGEKAQVFINLSLGSFAGPHDGSSVLERALDDLIERYDKRLTVVVAAGNTGHLEDDGTGVCKAGHARATLAGNANGYAAAAASSALAGFDWVVDRADETESFLEIWVPGVGPENTGARVSVSLQHFDAITGEPTQYAVSGVGPGEDKQVLITTDREGRGNVAAAVYNCTGAWQPPNGDGGLVLVALGHTRDPAGGPCAPTGRWHVSVTNLEPHPITFDVWCERRDIPGELRGYRPFYGIVAAEISGARTLSASFASLANGTTTVVVGALEPLEGSNPNPRLRADYTATGSGGLAGECNARRVSRLGPDVYAVGEFDAGGFLSGTKMCLAGTSMATAKVTGALVKQALLEKGSVSLPRKTKQERLIKLTAEGWPAENKDRNSPTSTVLVIESAGRHHQPG